MSGWITGLTGRANKVGGAATALRLRTSLEGLPIPIILAGRNRIGANLLDYIDFKALPQSSGSGKGLVGAGSGKGNAGKTYLYQVAVDLGICEGPLSDISAVWNNKSQETLAAMNLTAFLGGYAQNAWGYMTSAHPERAIPYRGIAHAAAGPMALGNTPELPNISFQVTSVNNTAVAGMADGDPADAIVNFLTNTHYGVDPTGLFPLASDIFAANDVFSLADIFNAPFTLYSNYAIAAGLLVSPVIATQVGASAWLADLCKATNSAPRWSSGALDIVPYGDTNLVNRGRTYIAPVTPIYDLTEDDFIFGENSSTSDPITITIKPADQMMNVIKVEFLDRQATDAAGASRRYDPAVVDAKEDGSINVYGARHADKFTAHFFCIRSIALRSAHLMLGREQIANTYQFSVPAKYIRLDPMDVVTITSMSSGLQLFRQPVRITEITENQDRTLTILAEDLLIGTANAPEYGAEASAGDQPDYNVDPGDTNSPLIFETPYQLGGGLVIDLAISGASADWGGAQVYVSNDGVTFLTDPDWRVQGGARVGVTTKVLNAVTPSQIAQTIDQVGVLSVNITESFGTVLTSGSQSDANNLVTLCYVDGEYIAYEFATLTATGKYDLSYLVRGAYNSEAEIVSHPIGSPFARVDGSLLKIPFTSDRVGSTIYFKLLSFNGYGGGGQTLDEVGAIAYVIKGTAFAVPLDDVTQVRQAYLDNNSVIVWDEISDFRTVRYEIRKGATWATALTVGTLAHPPFTVFGNDTYWIAAVAEPLPDLTVYSENPQSVVVNGAVIPTNLLGSHNEQTDGWPGTLSTSVAIIGATIQTDGFGLIGTYEVPGSHWYDALYVRPIRLQASWAGTGQSILDNILTNPNILVDPDILDSAAARFVSIYLEMAQSSSTGTFDIFTPADVFALADVFQGLVFGAFQKYAPGVYNTRLIKLRAHIESLDGNYFADLTAMSSAAYVVDRFDRYISQAIAAGGTALSFTPDGLGSAIPFLSGPNGGTVPLVSVTIQGATSGDTVKVTSLTLSGCTVQILNGGVGVARTCDIFVQGF